MSYGNLLPREIAYQTAAFQRYGDPNGMIEGARQAVRQMADEIASEFPNMAILLREQSPAGSLPLLTIAFDYFFRREVEENHELAHGLMFDGIQQLLANQARGFDQLGRAIASLTQGRIASAENGVSVEQITDLSSGKVHDALAILNLRLPENVRFPSDDIVRWLMEDHIRRIRGARGPRHYFLLAYSDGRPCGCTLIHSFQQCRLAFIAYLASDNTVPWVAAALFRKFKNLLDSDRYLSDCQGFLLEVEDPRLVPEGPEFTKRLALVRLFSSLAEQHGYCLRALEIEYYQPPLGMPTGAKTCYGVPLLLMYASKKRGRHSLPNDSVAKVLEFIYLKLYPEGHSPFPFENSAYRACLRPFCEWQVRSLPLRIRLMTSKDLMPASRGVHNPALE